MHARRPVVNRDRLGPSLACVTEPRMHVQPPIRQKGLFVGFFGFAREAWGGRPSSRWRRFDGGRLCETRAMKDSMPERTLLDGVRTEIEIQREPQRVEAESVGRLFPD